VFFLNGGVKQLRKHFKFRQMRMRKPCSGAEAPTAQTNYGTIRGRRLILKDGKEINAFLGVPYARPPLDELRFKVINNSIKPFNI
jgi:hypothetical protein